MDFASTVKRFYVRAWLITSLIVLFGGFAGQPVRAATFQPLEIATKSGVHVFSVEMATTEE